VGPYRSKERLPALPFREGSRSQLTRSIRSPPNFRPVERLGQCMRSCDSIAVISSILLAWRPPSNPVVRKQSKIANASSGAVTRAPSDKMFASLCKRANLAVNSSWQSAARAPCTLFASSDGPPQRISADNRPALRREYRCRSPRVLSRRGGGRSPLSIEIPRGPTRAGFASPHPFLPVRPAQNPKLPVRIVSSSFEVAVDDAGNEGSRAAGGKGMPRVKRTG
jgi:hypothetical protein